MEQHRKLKKCFQNELTVSKYDAALWHLWNTIGITSECERVDHLWTGPRIEIQKGLWREKLHLESSKYKDILCVVELTEVIESIDKLKGGSKNKAHKLDSQPSLATKQVDPKTTGALTYLRLISRRNVPLKKRTFSNKQAGGSKHAKFNGNLSRDSHPKWKELSEQEKVRFKSEGLCYQCGKSGHMARQCPDGKKCTFWEKQ